MVLSALALALLNVSGVCSHRPYSISNIPAGKEKEKMSPSCFGSNSSLCKLALQLRPRLHGQQVLSSYGVGKNQRVKAKLLCKGKTKSVTGLRQHIWPERLRRAWLSAVVAAPGDGPITYPMALLTADLPSVQGIVLTWGMLAKESVVGSPTLEKEAEGSKII